MLSYLANVARAVRFWSRLPVPVLAFETDPHAPPAMETLAPAVPVAGALIASTGAICLLASTSLGLPTWPGAIVAVAVTVLATGAMHEDAVADVADGFGGGRTVEGRLAIMKDPRLGSFGVAALSLSLMLKVALVAGLCEAVGVIDTAVVMIGAGSLARILGLWPLVALPAVRSAGAGAAAGQVGLPAWLTGAVPGGIIAVLAALTVVGFVPAILAVGAGFLAATAMAGLALRAIGGQTGDVCGAATALAELAFLAVVLAPLPS